MVNSNLIELVDIDTIEEAGYSNMIDISVTGDASFILSNGIISHNSALSAVRQFRNPQKFGAFPLRGKFINVSELSNLEVIKNQEVVGLMGALSIKFGESPFTYKKDSIKIKLIDYDNNEIIVDLNDEIYIDGKWVLVKSLV